MSKYCSDITPDKVSDISFEDSVKLLKSVIGEENFQKAIKFKIKSPIKNEESSEWIKTAKIIGINPRITKTFWGIIKYAMTFPENAVHIMPLWESGDGSLYVQNSWRLNNDFYDKNLETFGLDTCEKQLKFTVNVLHALGKAAGFDTMPHVDNFSEIVILNPDYFEWIKLNQEKTAQDFSVKSKAIPKQIKELIKNEYNLPDNFYDLEENERQNLLFPEDIDKFERRMEIRKLIRTEGFEPLPVVEHAPMRPIKFIKMEQSKNDDWAVFDVEHRSNIAIVIGAITPYKFYNIENGFPVKNSLDEGVLNYFTEHITRYQKEYDFDFLRADMAHNQIAHSHNNPDKDMSCKEIWAILKSEIQKTAPYFATFAESFLENYYISGIQDMINKNFDIVLGRLNYCYLNNEYIDLIWRYVEELKKYRFSTVLTIFTNDGDKEEHNNLYVSHEANICRYFVSMFTNMPSYMGMGYEVRDLEPKGSNYYSNYYVKPLSDKFEFGHNTEQFAEISKIRAYYEKYANFMKKSEMTFYDKRQENQLLWSYDNGEKQLLCAVNLNPEINYIDTDICAKQIKLTFTNSPYNEITEETLQNNILRINNIYLGEFVVYEIN